VPLQLTGDGDPGEEGEGSAERRVEPVDGVEEADTGHLHQVVDRLAVAVLEGQGPAKPS